MTDPKLAQEHRKFGRLYCLPGGTHPTRRADVAAAVLEQRLLPSITNIIDVRNKPHLVNWAAKKAATAAVDIAGSPHASRLAEASTEAIRWLTLTADRDRDAAAEQGSNVHDACENLARGLPCPALTANEMLHVDSWKAWLDRWQPQFLALERTVFGQTRTGLRYAGTTDFIARIAGLTLVGDYKSTRSGLHDDVAMQLSAVAHADFLSPDNEVLVPMMAIDGGIAVHLAPDGYHAAPVQLDGGVWESFQAFRQGWQFHAGEDNTLVTGERSLGRVLAGPESLAGHEMIRTPPPLVLAS
ncbi:hypothetical protein [Tessaracoccus sp.]